MGRFARRGKRRKISVSAALMRDWGRGSGALGKPRREGREGGRNVIDGVGSQPEATMRAEMSDRGSGELERWIVPWERWSMWST